MTKYQIPEMNLDRLQDHIAKLSKRAEKLGCPPVTMLVGDYVDRPWKSRSSDLLIRFYDVEVTGNAPVINGWRFLARIEHLPDGNILYTVPESEIPTWARTVGPKCDHCQMNRNRKDTFLVISETGDVKQVGSTCLGDFLGHADPQGLAEVAQSIAMLDEFCNECAEYDPDAVQGFEYLYRPEVYLAYVVRSIREHGWTSRGNADCGLGIIATADDAAFTLDQAKDDEKPTDADWQEALDALEWAKGYFIEENDLNDYGWNISRLLTLDAIRYKHFGLAASIVPAYHRELERRIKEANKVTCDEFVGEVKQRMQFDALTVEAVIPIESYYGLSHLHKMRDVVGHLFVWFASNFEAEQGDVLTGKGTIKDHTEYRGEKQTVLTRCKFEDV